MVFENFGNSLRDAIKKLLGKPIIDKNAVEEFIKTLQRAMFQADIHVELINALSENIRKRALKDELPMGISRNNYIVKVVYDEITSFLGKKYYPLQINSGETNILLMIGIQGSGKTTTTAKLANYLKKTSKTAIVCADTYRPGAFDQLSQLAKSIDVPIYGDPGNNDAVYIAKKGVEHFKSKKYEVIIVDTAGRHKDEKGLIKEMVQIARIINPTEIILVIDGTIGQQAAIQAHAFNKFTDIGSIIVTKLDGSAKGGGALSAVAATGAPIKFIGTGEKIDDLEKFNPKNFVGRLIGIPDLDGILERVKRAEIEPEKELKKKFLMGNFTLEDMMNQIKQFKKLGSMKKMLDMMGLAGQLPDEYKNIADDNIKKWKVIMDSMRKKERENPSIIKKSHIMRIARGSGTSYRDVKQLLDQYDMMKKMIKKFGKSRKLRKGGMPSMFLGGNIPPNMGQMPKKFKFRGKSYH
ncbi:MAG: signal recognition particle protein Srp54 [Candidatus Helarchaeota archaeon]